LVGRIAAGSWGAVFTGQALFLSPAFTAATSARLSFLVRPLMLGTTTGGSLGAESFAAPVAVLDAVDDPAGAATGVVAGVDEALAPTGDASAIEGPSGGTSPLGDGRVSWLAAHAIERARTTTLADKYLMNNVWVLLKRVDGGEAGGGK